MDPPRTDHSNLNATSMSMGRFDGLEKAWLEGLGSVNTRDAYRRDLAAFRAWCVAEGQAPLEVGSADVHRYRDACDDASAGRATVSRRLSALSSFFDHAVAAKAVDHNPVTGVGRPAPAMSNPASGLDDAEALALFDAAVELGPKVAVLVALLLWDGLKLGEALALDAGRIEGRGRSLHAIVVRRQRAVSLPLDERTALAIRWCLDGRDHGPLLVGDSPTLDPGSRLTRFGADFLLKRAARHAELERGISANTLRRTYIANAHRSGTAIDDIRHQVGHVSARDTRRYLA